MLCPFAQIRASELSRSWRMLLSEVGKSKFSWRQWRRQGGVTRHSLQLPHLPSTAGRGTLEIVRSHHSNRGRRTDSEKYPMRRLSQIGAGSTGWRSDLETRSNQSIWGFLAGALIAAAAVAGIIWAFVALA